MVSDIQFRHIDLFHGLSGELPLRTLSIPTVLTMHDVIFLRYPEFYHFWDRKIYEYKFRKACQSACKILAISHQTAEDAIHFLGADASKIEVIYQGCSPIFYRKSTPEDLESVKLKYQLPERFILSVGTIEERKNLINIIKALPLIDEEVSLVAIGRRTPYADAAEQVAEYLKVSSRLKMIHHAHFNDFPAIYAAAQMLVYPSFFEGFGLPVLEGLNIGIPVITSK